MCLETGIKKLVAKKDIVCYKVLKLGQDGNYTTPYYQAKVELNKELIASDCSHDYDSSRYKFIEDGFIHALLLTDSVQYMHGGGVVFKAIISAGTEFYVNDDFTEICARKMFITDTVVKNGTNKLSKEIIIEEMLDAYPQNIEKGKVAIGDFCAVDKGGNKYYIHRSEYTPKIDNSVIGVVGLFNEDGKPIVISRGEVYKHWCIDDEDVPSLINSSVDCRRYGFKESLNGMELTENILKSKHYNKKKYPLFEYIANFKTKGTKKGDWYVGSISELIQLSQNNVLINLSLMMLKNATLLKCHLWSSSEKNVSCAWFINSITGTPTYVCKDMYKQVRAFLCA